MHVFLFAAQGCEPLFPYRNGMGKGLVQEWQMDKNLPLHLVIFVMLHLLE